MSRVVTERKDVIAMLAEIFREHGYDGTSLSLITEKTGLGKGSLYHFFPGGKEEMAEAVLGDISAWFRTHIFDVLRGTTDAEKRSTRCLPASTAISARVVASA